MGKYPPVFLCALLALGLWNDPGKAQGADTTGFVPSRFMTADDFAHLAAALDYVNLSPEQLSYEKKHLDHRLRLAVCDQALDRPLGLPAVADRAATEFSTRMPAVLRTQHAARLLDLPLTRWTPEELQKDGERAFKRIWEDDRDYKDEDPEVFSEVQRRDAFGGKSVRLHPVHSWSDSSFTLTPISALDTLARVPQPLSETEIAVLAGGVSTMLGAPPLPGATAADAPPYDAGAKIDIAAILTAAGRLGLLLDQTAMLWGKKVAVEGPAAYSGTPSEVPGITGSIIACWQGPWGKFVIGGTGPNTYEGDDFIGIIDLGGDDTYRGRVASGIGLAGRSPISFVLDLSGNDRYEGGDFTQGFGFLGVGMLHDLGGGNDSYSAGFCAQGAGLCGYGEIYDDGGDDVYRADSFAQGAGVFGHGHLIDARGNDVYRGARYVQAFAQVRGVGVLTDGAGNDLYYAGGKYLHQPLWNDRYQSLSQGFAIGNRNDGTGGGVALLLDQGDGNDVYQADIYGQGSSYWYSLGMLVDEGGNDTYTLGQYGQGAGIHLSAGILVDLAGNDTYTNPFGVGTGGAHDWAVGILIDRAGNDLYQGNGIGQGLNFALGLLLDCAGNDSYASANEGSVGKGHNNDISLVLDLAGADSYGPKEVRDGQFTRRGRHALVYDVPEGWFAGIDPATLPTPQDPPPARSSVQHILIAWDGTGVQTQKAPRDKEQARALALEVMRQARSKNADWPALQLKYNEDVAPHNTYEATPRAPLVKPFLDTALALGVGQIDLCETRYGWHIIKRVQ